MSDSTALSLSQLPPEVLHVIFYYLDIPDILRLRRVSRYLDGISHNRQVWTNAYHTAEFVRPPGPFLWQSACDLETALVCGFRVDRNLRNGSGPARTEKPALKMREIRCKNFYGGVNLVFGRFLLIGFRNEICCYDLNIEVLDCNRDPIIMYRSPGQQLGEFYCVSSFDIEGRPFACAILFEDTDASPRFSIYSLHVEEQSGVTLECTQGPPGTFGNVNTASSASARMVPSHSNSLVIWANSPTLPPTAPQALSMAAVGRLHSN